MVCECFTIGDRERRARAWSPLDFMVSQSKNVLMFTLKFYFVDFLLMVNEIWTVSTCKHGKCEFMALQRRIGRIFQTMILFLRLFKALSLPTEAKVTVLSVEGIFYNLYLTIQQDSISRLKMSWEDIKWFLNWIIESAIHTLFSISLWAEQIHGWQWQQCRGRKCGSVFWEYVPWAYFKTKQNKNTCKPFALQEVSVGARDKSHPWKERFSSLQRTWWTAGKEIPPSLFHFKV